MVPGVTLSVEAFCSLSWLRLNPISKGDWPQPRVRVLGGAMLGVMRAKNGVVSTTACPLLNGSIFEEDTLPPSKSASVPLQDDVSEVRSQGSPSKSPTRSRPCRS